MRRRLGALAGAMLLLGLMAGPAMAGGPTRSTIIDEGSYEIDCGAFVLLGTYRDRIIVKEWLDGSGELIKAQFHHSWTGTIDGPGGILKLNDPGHFTAFIDADSVRQVGLIYRYIVPGHGLIAHDVGIIEFDAETGEATVIRGPHDVFDQGLESLICPLFE